MKSTPLQDAKRVPLDRLRCTVDPTVFQFESTQELAPQEGVMGKDSAMDALRYGLEVHAPGQNVFVRGLTGTARLDLVQSLIQQIQPSCPLAKDRCYVHNFVQPDRPTLLNLPRGRGREFARRVDELSAYIRTELIPALSSEDMKARGRSLATALEAKTDSSPLEKELAAAGLALVPIKKGEDVGTAIVPLVDGNPVGPEEFEALRKKGIVDEETANKARETVQSFRQRFHDFNNMVAKAQAEHRTAMAGLYTEQARRLMDLRLTILSKDFASQGVSQFLDAILEDVVERLQYIGGDQGDITERYQVNVLVNHREESCPVIVENTPTLRNLLGNIDTAVSPDGSQPPAHMMIRAGSLLRAESGFLILNAKDLISESGAWKVLVRTLRTGELEIVPHDLGRMGSGPTILPQPIDLNVKIVLIGDAGIYYGLDANDADFGQLFKVLADFDGDLPNDQETREYYARTLARLAKDEALPPFSRDAVAALCEHGARIAGRHDRLTTKFARLFDLAREAAYINRSLDPAHSLTVGEHVYRAIDRTRERAGNPSKRFRNNIAEGTIRIETRGRAVGQINGMAVMSAGPLTFGFPARITASVGPGMRGMVDIERESSLSGRIHTKGFHILGGLLRHLFRTHHPLAFNASLAFEQSYGGVDGDSASGAETCCLLSALTGIPLKQSLAMTGAIDQFGNIQPIGGASEKIEGFFAACVDAGLTGDQGIILPSTNVRNLVLRKEVTEACAAGRFHIYAVDHVTEAVELFTDMPAGESDEDGNYPKGTLLGLGMDRLHEYWFKSRGVPYITEEEAEVVQTMRRRSTDRPPDEEFGAGLDAQV
ncbi:MAG: ATP-binding protein [Planctomycetota bacterium]|nr:ATP-binding protein [Planctomycetota bacterium]